MNIRTDILYIFHSNIYVILVIFCVAFSPNVGYNNSKKTEMFSLWDTRSGMSG